VRAARAIAWMLLAAATPAMATHDESLLTAALTRAPGQSLEALRVTYAPGESWFEPAAARHLVSANASDSERVTFLVVFVGKAPN